LSSTIAVTRRWKYQLFLACKKFLAVWFQARKVNFSPLDKTAQAIRAFLAAMATTARQ
jgi:hypothetical protein